MAWIAKGKTNLDISRILGLRVRTVEKQMEHALEKLGVETRAAAVARFATALLPGAHRQSARLRSANRQMLTRLVDKGACEQRQAAQPQRQHPELIRQ